MLGMANLVVGLFVGLTEEHGMGPELILLGVGSLCFLVGRLLERGGKMRSVFIPWIIVGLAGSVPLAHAIDDRAIQSYRRAEDLRRGGQYEEAVDLYRDTLRIMPAHPTAFDRLREVVGRERTASETMRMLEAAVARDPGDFVAWNLLGVIYGRERRWDEALEAFARSLAVEPGAADTLVNRGWVLMELRRYDAAVSAFETALTHQPGLARAHAGIGSAVVEARGDYAEGMRQYLKALELDPENPALLNDLGWLSYKTHRYPEAVAALEKAAALDPHNPMIQTNLGLAYQKAGRADQAVTRLEQAVAIDPKYALALYGLGKAHESRGQYPEAADAYRRAWKQSGNDLYLLLWFQAYMSSRGQVMIVFLFGFAAVGGVIALWTMRGRRAQAAKEG